MNSIVVIDVNDLKSLISECINEALSNSKPPEKKHEPKLITLNEVIKILGVSDTTIYNIVMKESFDIIKSPGVYISMSMKFMRT